MEFLGCMVYGLPEIFLGVTASAVSVALYLYTIPSFYRIHMGYESTGRLQPYPLCFTSVVCTLWGAYAFATGAGATTHIFRFQNTCLLIVSGIGFFVQWMQISIFAERAPSNQHICIRIILWAEILLGLAGFGYPWFPDFLRDLVLGPKNNNIFGLAASVFGIVMYASTVPLIVDSCKKKTTTYLPLGLCTLHFLNAIAWFAYALYTPTYDVYLAIANGGGIILGIVQLIICSILLVKFQKSGATVGRDMDPKTPLLDAIV